MKVLIVILVVVLMAASAFASIIECPVMVKVSVEGDTATVIQTTIDTSLCNGPVPGSIGLFKSIHEFKGCVIE